MLIGQGAINGREINSLEIDGGRFTVWLDDALASVAVNGQATILVRHPLRGWAEIALINALNLYSPPKELAGTAAIPLDTLGIAVRRRALFAGTAVALDIHGRISTDVALEGYVRLSLEPLAQLDRSHIGTWMVIRRIVVPPGLRHLDVAPQPRYMAVPADDNLLERQKDAVIQ